MTSFVSSVRHITIAGVLRAFAPPKKNRSINRDNIMRHRVFAIALSLACIACSGERLTGPAAQKAALRYQAQANSTMPTPLFLLDGKEISAEQARTIDTKIVNTIEVMKGPAAIQAFGARARDGVIFITTKSVTGPGPQ